VNPATRRAWWRVLPAVLLIAFLTTVSASAAGSGGWDHLGTGGAPNTAALNGAVYALLNDGSGNIYAGGAFTQAGPRQAPHLAAWISGDHEWLGSGQLPTVWTSHPLNGDIHAMAWDGAHSRLFVGGTFTNADGDPSADYLAVWENRWKPFCSPAPAFGGSVSSLQIIGSTLYVGGAFQNGASIRSANYLIACDLNTGVARAVGNPNDLNGGVYALAADAAGTLYVGGQFSNVANIVVADHIASFDGEWHALGSGVPDYVRSLAASGNDVYIGTDSVDIAGIPQADHIARWNGSAWSALGANAAGTDGWLPKAAFIYAIAATSSQVVVTGSFQNADGNAAADHIARFDGTKWAPLGSNGAGNGPWIGNGLAVAILGTDVYAGGNFTSAGGDAHAAYIARYSLLTAPSNVFTVAAVTRNLVAGTAKLTINTPGRGTLTLSGSGVRRVKVATSPSARTTKLTVEAAGKARLTLNRLGHITVKPTITFAPTGGTARSRSTTVVLKKRQ
jgi:trimeric autotransporter adhesin